MPSGKITNRPTNYLISCSKVHWFVPDSLAVGKTTIILWSCNHMHMGMHYRTICMLVAIVHFTLIVPQLVPWMVPALLLPLPSMLCLYPQTSKISV